MPNPAQVTPDGDQQINSENEVAEELARARAELLPSVILVCTCCGDLIGELRKKALPSAITCITCAEALPSR